MIEQLTALLVQYGLLFVFINVFLVQAGAPVPAVPTLMIAGALTTGGALPLPGIIAVAIVGSLLGDLIWYAAGRRYGLKVLQLLCRISLSPDSCVRQTETRFTQWGAPSLIIAKFVPGFATVAPPLAGALQVKPWRFVLYSTISAALWAGVAAGAGRMLNRQIDWALNRMDEMGANALILIAAVFVIFIAYKWWERQRFYKALRMARISVKELNDLIAQGHAPVVVDVRSASAREIDPRRVPGSVVVDIADLDARLGDLPPDRDIILYCT
jgi:membrane protein DedA with SNARE-associated domain